MKLLLKIIAWFSLAIPTFIFSVETYQGYSATKGIQGLIRQEVNTFKNSPITFTSLPRLAITIKTAVAKEDARPIVIHKYMARYDSPMLDYAKYIVDISDSYGVDPYLIVAIAQQESNLGKLMPKDCHNAWGWGIHSAGTLCFDSWEEGINMFISGLAKNYLAYGLRTPQEIMTKYNSTSPDGAWAKGVSQFLSDLQTGDW